MVGVYCLCFFFQAEDGIRDLTVTGVQTCALPISIQQRGEALRARQGEKPRLAQEKAHGGRDRPTRSLNHIRDAEVEPAGAFAVRGGNESKRAAVEKNTRWHNGPAQKA